MYINWKKATESFYILPLFFFPKKYINYLATENPVFCFYYIQFPDNLSVSLYQHRQYPRVFDVSHEYCKLNAATIVWIAGSKCYVRTAYTEYFQLKRTSVFWHSNELLKPNIIFIIHFFLLLVIPWTQGDFKYMTFWEMEVRWHKTSMYKLCVIQPLSWTFIYDLMHYVPHGFNIADYNVRIIQLWIFHKVNNYIAEHPMSVRHVNARKSYLHYGNFSGEVILCSKFPLFFTVFWDCISVIRL